MTFLPIVTRELRIRSRRRSTWFFRMAVTALAGLIGILMLGIRSVSGPGSQLGAALLYTLASFMFAYCYLEGVRSAADSLSQEKREGTLGFLFLTDLRGYDVVLGKFVVSSINSFYGLVAVLPIIALSLLLGGVTPGQYWRVAIALLNALFFVVATALFVSSRSRNQAPAWTGSFALAVGISSVGPLLTVRGGGFSGVFRIVDWISPLTAFRHALAPTAFSADYWPAVLTAHIAAWAFIAGASVILPRSWQDRPALPALATLAHRSNEATRATIAETPRRQKRRTENPIAWLVLRKYPRLRFLHVMVGIATLAVVVAGLSGVSGSSFVVAPFIWATKVAVVFQACRFFSEARQSGALELILSTPLSTNEIIKGQWLALRQVFLWPLLLLLAVYIASLIDDMNTDFSGRIISLFLITYRALTFTTNFVALAYVGMWVALKVSKPTHAMGITLGLVWILPNLLFCIPGVAFDLVYIFLARDAITTSLRDARTAAAPPLTIGPAPTSVPA